MIYLGVKTKLDSLGMNVIRQASVMAVMVMVGPCHDIARGWVDGGERLVRQKGEEVRRRLFLDGKVKNSEDKRPEKS